MPLMDESLSLVALFASSFLAATLLPGGSEAVLFGVLKLDPQQYWPALAAKNARIAWALLAHERTYQSDYVAKRAAA